MSKEDTSYLVVLCTCPDADTAAKLARELVESRVAACVNILPSVRSVYRWRDAVEDGTEALMLVKTPARRFDQLQRILTDKHPYELPEIIAVPIERGLMQYLAWIDDNT